MKKKILIALMALLLPSFIVVNLLADNKKARTNSPLDVNNEIVIDSPLFTQKETGQKYDQPNELKVVDNFEKVLENNNFSLYLKYEQDNCYIGSIALENKQTGYFWRSDIVGDKIIDEEVNYAFEVRYYDAAKGTSNSYAYPDTSNFSYKVTDDSVKFKVNITKAKIQFEYVITLTETGFDLYVPVESIKEEDNLLVDICFFPNLGHVYQNSIPGYAFIPSGNGGLVRFDKTPAISKTYTRRYYGADAHLDKSEVDVLSVPVYGITHGVNQNAFLTRIKSGASIASLNYIPSSDISNSPTGYHRVYNTFSYRETYNIEISGEPIPMMSDFYATDIEVGYSFLSNSEANYIGMAKEYQRQLEFEGVISLNSNSGSGNVHIDVLGGETEKGIVLDKFVKMTTTKQILTINDDLTKKYDNKFIYTLRGFYKNGYSKQSYGNIKFDSRLGSLNDLKGLDYYMYYNPVESYNSKVAHPNNVVVNAYKEKHSITVEEGTKYKFYTEVDSVIGGVNSALNKYVNSLAIDSLGYRLYGDENSKYTRVEVEQMYSQLLDDTMPLFKPNEYFLGNTSHYLNMPLYHDRLRFITDSVPFLQIVLRGYVDYYSTYLNFSTNSDIDLLKCIEYGSNLAYLISYEESYKVANTLSSHLYATYYESNRESMFEQINSANRAFNSIKNQKIVDREVIETGIVKVTYGNDVEIYVNYTDTSYTVPGYDGRHIVLPMNFEVVE